jgi:hypothetical protein
MRFRRFKALSRRLGSGGNRLLVGSVHVIFQMAGLVESTSGSILSEMTLHRRTSPFDFETTPEIGEESKAKL